MYDTAFRVIVYNNNHGPVLAHRVHTTVFAFAFGVDYVQR